ncbi:hypothetical protein GGX14DRAFT_386188 [Mycena pura]|uniref:Uncharacterized protein n=1 Tax=Mycena pura TaxID=153505 RepID=A0AAD6YPF7_9AGAR|nr:hypothetical protein GGX14DRAFT_386188 [Mycena pura]
MQYPTLHYAAPVPKVRARRNTTESGNRRQRPVIQLVKASQQQHYAYKYMDDQASFERVQKAEEEKIQQDNEREVRARRRNKARKAALASKAAEQNPSFTPTKDAWNPAENLVHGPVVARPQRAPFRVVQNSERSRLESFTFPRVQPSTPVRKPPLQGPANPSPTKRLAPLPPFNPFVRMRSESLSSLIDEMPPVQGSPGKLKRNASVSALFARIHREAEHMRRYH